MKDLVKAFRKEYIPLLVVYFTTGLAGLSAIAQTLFLKDILGLSAETLIEIGIYTGLPWSIKMVFGSIIDSVTFFRSNRKFYIFVGQAFVILGIIGTIDIASTQYLVAAVGEYMAVLLTGLSITLGVVISDIVADVMAIELVPNDHPEREKQLGLVQVMARLALVGGALLGSTVAGPLAAALPIAKVFAIELLCPFIAIVVTALAPAAQNNHVSPVNIKIILGGTLYGAFVILSGAFLNQDVIFLGSLLIIGLMLKGLLRDFDQTQTKGFVLAMIAIFLFRVVPGIGPAGSWWYMNELGFDEHFMGMLRIIANVAGLVTLAGLANSITSNSLLKTMSALIALMTILSIPDILIFYDLTGGLSPRTIALMDTAMIAPLAQLSMIPLGVLVARHAPAASKATYLAVTASLMNISLVGGDIITKYLNKLFIVTREDFTHLGKLMIISLSISTLLSIIGLLVLKFGSKK